MPRKRAAAVPSMGTSPWSQGRNARDLGLSEEMNPYDPGESCYAWYSGWHQRDQEIEAGREVNTVEGEGW